MWLEASISEWEDVSVYASLACGEAVTRGGKRSGQAERSWDGLWLLN